MDKLTIGQLNAGWQYALNAVIEQINEGGVTAEVTPAAAVADSEASTIAALKDDFNALLASLRAAGFIAAE